MLQAENETIEITKEEYLYILDNIVDIERVIKVIHYRRENKLTLEIEEEDMVNDLDVVVVCPTGTEPITSKTKPIRVKRKRKRSSTLTSEIEKTPSVSPILETRKLAGTSARAKTPSPSPIRQKTGQLVTATLQNEGKEEEQEAEQQAETIIFEEQHDSRITLPDNLLSVYNDLIQGTKSIPDNIPLTSISYTSEASTFEYTYEPPSIEESVDTHIQSIMSTSTLAFKTGRAAEYYQQISGLRFYNAFLARKALYDKKKRLNPDHTSQQIHNSICRDYYNLRVVEGQHPPSDVKRDWKCIRNSVARGGALYHLFSKLGVGRKGIFVKI